MERILDEPQCPIPIPLGSEEEFREKDVKTSVGWAHFNSPEVLTHSFSNDFLN